MYLDTPQGINITNNRFTRNIVTPVQPSREDLIKYMTEKKNVTSDETGSRLLQSNTSSEVIHQGKTKEEI